MKRLIAVTAAVGLGLTGLATAGTASAGATARPTAATTSNTVPVTPSSVNWGTCSSTTLQRFGAVCGMLDVPLDYSRPNGTKIQLALSMVRHTVPDSQYQGIMLVNPGGPGGSGLIYSVFQTFIPNNAGAAYDWIGFDPRGVGSSVPSLSCIPDYFQGPRPNYTPVNKAVEKAWLDRSAAYATACGQNGGALLDHLTTVDSAKDMNSIRSAMGQQQINYLGFSYGTYLGSVFGTMFPNRLRRAVFDSTVDPNRVFYKSNLDQDVAFEKNIQIWFAWVAKYNSVYHLGNTGAKVEKLWYKTMNDLYKNPAGGVVGGAEWNDIFLYAGYYQQTWLDLGDAFSAYVNNHDVARIVSEYEDAEGVGNDNGFAMYLATQCTDAPWPQNYAKIKRDNERVAKNHPFETWGNAWFNGPCLGWPGDARQSAVKVDGSQVKSLLMVDETLDAATPYAGSLVVRKLFPGASLIALPGGTSHANSLNGDACLDDQIAAYMADGTLPPRKSGNRADTTCQPLPVPDPTAAAAQAQAQAKTATGAVSRESLSLPLIRP
jgi:pimeloyl-ACP methyl ester carboxylesterase